MATTSDILREMTRQQWAERQAQDRRRYLEEVQQIAAVQAQLKGFINMAPPLINGMLKDENDSILVTPGSIGTRYKIIVVGCGGTGARLIPPLMQSVDATDQVVLVDDDLVEPRNLFRQHFSHRDVGRPKAQILAERYNRGANNISASVVKLNGSNLLSVLGSPGIEAAPVTTRHPIIIGCVDNNETRRLLATELRRHFPRHIYIDAGNETRHGQVLLNFQNWPMTYMLSVGGQTVRNSVGMHLRTLELAMPQLLRSPVAWHCDDCDVEVPAGKPCPKCSVVEGSCRNRIDLQTVMVNNTAATAILNLLTVMMLRRPLPGAGTFFTTSNSMQQIKFAGIDFRSNDLIPETTYAIKA